MKVVIVGGGVAGLSIGWRLRQAGAEVTILERAQPGHGATWAAAGMLSASGETGDEHPAETRLARHAAQQWPAFAREIQEVSGRTIGYRADGKLIVARDVDERARLEVLARRMSGSSMLVAEAARALEPMLAHDTVGALFDPDESQVDNRALGVALAHAFLKTGGDLQVNDTVVRIETDGSRVLGARTPFRVHEGDAYLLAAGAWSSRIEGLPDGVVPTVIPVKGEMIALEGGTRPKHIVWGGGVYLVSRGKRLLVGATATREGFDTTLTQGARDWLRERACLLMPSLKDWAVAEHWAGLRPGSPDDLPILGRTAIDGLFVASGQYRNGILFAPAIADALCALLLDRTPRIDITAFDPRRFSLLANIQAVR